MEGKSFGGKGKGKGKERKGEMICGYLFGGGKRANGREKGGKRVTNDYHGVEVDAAHNAADMVTFAYEVAVFHRSIIRRGGCGVLAFLFCESDGGAGCRVGAIRFRDGIYEACVPGGIGAECEEL